jgi:hypothetical protein
VHQTDIWGHDRIVMCEIFIGEIEAKKLNSSLIPYYQCTHVLFRIILTNGTVPSNVMDGEAYLHFPSFFGFIPGIYNLRHHSLSITAKRFIDEIKARNTLQKPETEIILYIMTKRINKGLGTAYWNQRLQRSFAESLKQCLRFQIKSYIVIMFDFRVKRFN